MSNITIQCVHIWVYLRTIFKMLSSKIFNTGAYNIYQLKMAHSILGIVLLFWKGLHLNIGCWYFFINIANRVWNQCKIWFLQISMTMLKFNNKKLEFFWWKIYSSFPRTNRAEVESKMKLTKINKQNKP